MYAAVWLSCALKMKCFALETGPRLERSEDPRGGAGQEILRGEEQEGRAAEREKVRATFQTAPTSSQPSWVTQPCTARAVWLKSPAAADLRAGLHIPHLLLLFRQLQSVCDSTQRRYSVRDRRVSCSPPPLLVFFLPLTSYSLVCTLLYTLNP